MAEVGMTVYLAIIVVALLIAIAPLMVWIHASRISSHTKRIVELLEKQAEQSAPSVSASGPTQAGGTSGLLAKL